MAEIWSNVEREAVERHPALHTDADGADFGLSRTLSNPNADAARGAMGGDPDIRRLVCSLEGWMIAALGELGVPARREPGRIGIWVGEGPHEAKIGAIGIRVKRWVTMHGFSLNVAPDLTHFTGIVPCGVADFGVTSLAALGKEMPMTRVDAALKLKFPSFLKDLALTDKVS